MVPVNAIFRYINIRVVCKFNFAHYDVNLVYTYLDCIIKLVERDLLFVVDQFDRPEASVVPFQCMSDVTKYR